MGCLIHGPITDADLQGRNTLIFDPGDGGLEVVTIPLPSSVGLEAYYNRGTTGSGGDDWMQAVMGALSAVSPDDWLAVEYSPSLPEVIRTIYTAGYAPLDHAPIFYFAQAASTLDAHLLGMQRGINTSAPSNTVISPYHKARLWRHDIPARHRWTPGRLSRSRTSLSGRVESRSAGGWRRWHLRLSALPGPLVFTSDAQDPEIGPLMFEALQDGDPNFALDACWASWVSGAPVRFTPDESAPEVYHELRIVGDALDGIDKVAREYSDAPPFFDVELEAIEQL